MARRQPPAARFDCHPDPIWRLACRALYGAALAAVAWTVIGQVGWAGSTLAQGVAGLLLLLPGLWPRRPRPSSLLRWDGRTWWLSDAKGEHGVRPEVVLDLGDWMLLRLRWASVWRLPRYLALRRRDQGFGWAQLRVLLWQARPDAEPGADMPPA